MRYAAKFRFRVSNNKAEYEAVSRGMELAVRLGVRHLTVYSDSHLISQQDGGTFEAIEERIRGICRR